MKSNNEFLYEGETDKKIAITPFDDCNYSWHNGGYSVNGFGTLRIGRNGKTVLSRKPKARISFQLYCPDFVPKGSKYLLFCEGFCEPIVVNYIAYYKDYFEACFVSEVGDFNIKTNLGYEIEEEDDDHDI